MGGSARIVDRDHGYKALVKRIKSAAEEQVVTVGIHSAEGGAPAESGDGISVLEVATIQEFGLGNVPARSFVRAWADEQKGENEAILKKLAESVVKGQNTTHSALDKAGLVFVASMRQRVRGGIPPALHPTTIARKGSSTPLIDTGQLVGSITHKVE